MNKTSKCRACGAEIMFIKTRNGKTIPVDRLAEEVMDGLEEYAELAADVLKKEIQDYVKTHTAPYNYPRIVVFRDSLPKTISGKIQRNLL